MWVFLVGKVVCIVGYLRSVIVCVETVGRVGPQDVGCISGGKEWVEMDEGSVSIIVAFCYLVL